MISRVMTVVMIMMSLCWRATSPDGFSSTRLQPPSSRRGSSSRPRMGFRDIVVLAWLYLGALQKRFMILRHLAVADSSIFATVALTSVKALIHTNRDAVSAHRVTP